MGAPFGGVVDRGDRVDFVDHWESRHFHPRIHPVNTANPINPITPLNPINAVNKVNNVTPLADGCPAHNAPRNASCTWRAA